MKSWLTENIFAITIVLVLLAVAGIFYNAYLSRDFPVYLTEEEIELDIEERFPLFVDYL